MIHKLAFVHTSHVLIPTFADLAKQLLPELETFHITDESLIKNTIAAGHLTMSTTRRLLRTIESAHEGGAEAVMVTCSSLGPAVEVARSLLDFPVFRVDEAMAEAAIARGTRIGVSATLNTTLAPTISLLEQTAARNGRSIEIVPRLAEGAFAAVISGDTERHDALVKDMLIALRREVDVVVLAQASMARVAGALPVEGAPILTSPELAIRQAKDVLQRAVAHG